MKKVRLRRPSPAMVVAVLALFVALGGTASAALVITGRNVRNGSLTGHDVRNGSLTGHDVRNNSLTAHDIRGRLQGPAGPPGAAGSAKAYAEVLAGGQLNGFVSKGIVRVSHPAAGYYCFYLGFQPQNVTATLDSLASPGVDAVKATLTRDDAHGDKCAGVESASVRTIATVGKHPGFHNGAFYVAFN